MRRILTYALAALFAAFFWVIVSAPATHAADATWSGAVIKYNGNDYNGPASAKTITDLGLLNGTKAYTYIEPAPTSVGSAPPPQRNIHVIYFAPGADSSVATSAKYKTYVYQGPSNFTNPTAPTDVTLAKQSTAANPGTTSCDVSGIGWIVCPITTFLAKGMDWIFNILSGFLAVRPVATSQDTSLYRAWTYMRNFANVAFVIAFLIIIYSQLTNLGITNYSIKKLLPRLIIAALLVNLSYYICAVAVDLSNILGYSIQSVFIQLRNSLVGTEGNSWNVVSWDSITGFILSGGTLAAAGTIGLITTLSTYGLAGSIFLLLPALVAGLMAVLVALIIMATRQAIITILIIIAPLAFVAYLLPNTEKWFDKWRSTFMTMLILFPAFSVVFGGSQLAAAAIIQNADSINLIILGMLVQVAPLFVTPLLIKLSGSLLGKIASTINNPNKGIIDRTRNWSKERSDNIKARRLGTGARPGFKGAAQRNAQRLDHNRRVREGYQKYHESIADNRFAGSAANQRLHEAQHEAETAKKTIEERLSRDLSIKVKVTPEMLKKEMAMRIVSDEAATEKGKLDRIHEGMRAGVDPTSIRGIGGVPVGGVLTELTKQSEAATRDLALSAIASQNSKRIQQSIVSGSLLRNNEQIDGQLLRDYAGGVDFKNGADSALAFAVTQKYEADVKLVNERVQLIKQFKLNGDQRQNLAMRKLDNLGNLIPVQGKYVLDGQTYTYDFSPDDAYAQDAAIDYQFTAGSYNNIKEIIQNSGGSLKAFNNTISGNISTKGVPDKAAWMGGVFIDKVVRGDIVDLASMQKEIVDTFIMKGKIQPERWAKNDAEAISDMKNAIISQPRTADLNLKLAKLKETIAVILDKKSEMYGSTTEASRDAFAELSNIL